MEVAVEPVENVGAEGEALFDVVAAALVIPAGLDDGEKFRRVALVDLSMEFVDAGFPQRVVGGGGTCSASAAASSQSKCAPSAGRPRGGLIRAGV